MVIIVIITGFILLAGIVFLFLQPKSEEKPRAEILAQLAKYFEGTVEQLDGYKDAFLLKFSFDGKDFYYDDVPESGFASETFKGVLKCETGIKMSLEFAERKKGAVKSHMVMMTNVSNARTPPKVKVPKCLDSFIIHTDDAERTACLFEDAKILQFLQGLKNMDRRGYPSMAFRIVDGTLMITFSPIGSFKPNRQALFLRPSYLESYLEKMITISKKLQEFEK